MKKNLLLNACVKFFSGLLVVGLLLFIPAWTLRYWNAWLFIVLLFVPMLIVGAVLWVKAPELLAKRLSGREQEAEQKTVIVFSACVFLAGFVTASLDFRFGWSGLPLWLVVLAAVLMTAAYALIAEVMRENAYLSRTVEVQENQKVIDTGLYGLVRHPMYFATILLYLAIPLVLGSVFAFLIFLLYIPLIVRRIHNEEAVLEQGLAGYRDYEQRVKYRLIPHVW